MHREVEAEADVLAGGEGYKVVGVAVAAAILEGLAAEGGLEVVAAEVAVTRAALGWQAAKLRDAAATGRGHRDGSADRQATVCQYDWQCHGYKGHGCVRHRGAMLPAAGPS